MKKIIIEISETQHQQLKDYLEKCFNSSIAEESMDDYSLKLTTSFLGSTLDVEMYGKIELGDITWKIED
jgi:hypothetical protein